MKAEQNAQRMFAFIVSVRLSRNVGARVPGAHVGADGRRGADGGAARARHQRALPGPRVRRAAPARAARLPAQHRRRRAAAARRQARLHALSTGNT